MRVEGATGGLPVAALDVALHERAGRGRRREAPASAPRGERAARVRGSVVDSPAPQYGDGAKVAAVAKPRTEPRRRASSIAAVIASSAVWMSSARVRAHGHVVKESVGGLLIEERAVRERSHGELAHSRGGLAPSGAFGGGIGQLRAARSGLGQRRVVEPDRDLRCVRPYRQAAHSRARALEARRQRSLASVHLLEPVLQHPRRVIQCPCGSCVRPGERAAGASRVAHQADGAGQVLDRLCLPRRALGLAEREQDVLAAAPASESSSRARRSNSTARPGAPPDIESRAAAHRTSTARGSASRRARSSCAATRSAGASSSRRSCAARR